MFTYGNWVTESLLRVAHYCAYNFEELVGRPTRIAVEQNRVKSTRVRLPQASVPDGFVQVDVFRAVTGRTDDIVRFDEVVGADLVNVFTNALSSFG